MSVSAEINSENNKQQSAGKNKRGRPKGSKTTTLAEVRKQAAEEKAKIRLEMSQKISELQAGLEKLKKHYELQNQQLTEEVETLKRREANYQQALGEKLLEVADKLQSTLVNWGTAELEEAQVDKRGRGRPRKTLK